MCICTAHVFTLHIHMPLYCNIKPISAAQLSRYEEHDRCHLTMSMIFHLTVRMRAYARTGSPHCIRHGGTSIFPSFLSPLFYLSLSLRLSLPFYFDIYIIRWYYAVRFASRLFSLGARRKPRTVVAKGKKITLTR